MMNAGYLAFEYLIFDRKGHCLVARWDLFRNLKKSFRVKHVTP